MATSVNIPAGLGPLQRSTPAIELIGPIHAKDLGSEMVVGSRAEPKHCNTHKTVHGGTLATLADVALSYSSSFSIQPPTTMVTACLSLDYAGAARVGDGLETSVDIQKIGSRLVFAGAHIHVNRERIVRASAVFSAVTALSPSARADPSTRNDKLPR